ncbi:uncharacterized protein LOC113317196 isoform X3 [Papaver somniferum]|uniref:uncharacterized protein LOC113317196 isoform X3 n=1 Tax=Papaver somniferum TaxID=3469 RepID=UPI000E6F786E|nr:uncharacterized protein LOC113317196 isoform X3 [Papaver somniferum]
MSKVVNTANSLEKTEAIRTPLKKLEEGPSFEYSKDVIEPKILNQITQWKVADVNRMNGLVTDLQMFALKTLQIPLPGRHPPSASLSNGHPSPGTYKTVTSSTDAEIRNSP